MNNNLYKLKDFEEITEKEYNFYEQRVENCVFQQLYKKGINKNLIKVPNYNSIEEDEVFYSVEDDNKKYLGYSYCPEKKERLLHFFDKKVIEEKINKENSYFKVFLDQVELIDKCIRPIFKELGIDYEIHLAGGALRDHLLDKSDQVKDLDILIEFLDILYVDKMPGRHSSDRRQEQNKTIEKFVNDNDIILRKYNIEIKNNQSREKILHEIVLQSVSKLENIELKNFLLWKEESKEETNNILKEIKNKKEVSPDDSLLYDGLFSVIKVNRNDFKYPIDLLLNSNRHSYLYYFDFNLCKCLYTIKKLEINKNIENLYLDEGFMKDVIEKQLSLNAEIFSDNKQVDRCLKDHYIRLQTKYPDYKMNILEKNMESKSEILMYIQKAHNYYRLENKLNKQSISPIIKRNKI